MGKSSEHDDSSESTRTGNFKLMSKITNGRSSKKVRAANSPSPKKSYNIEHKVMGEAEVMRDNEGNQEGVAVIELTSATDAVVPSHSGSRENSETKQSKSERMFDKISEKASKYKGSIGKFFQGEKEPEVPTIYTIDREMGRSNMAYRQDEGAEPNVKRYHQSPTKTDGEKVFQRSELTDRLRKSRQHPTSPDPSNMVGKDMGVQVTDYPPYRLLFVPPEDWRDPDSPVTTVTRLIMCQCTTGCFLLLWIIFGALVFYLTEGPYEIEKMAERVTKERDNILAFATDLRLISQNNTDWIPAITKYTEIHAKEVRIGTMNSYGSQQPFWTFPGSLMFCVSLLTTLGLAVPLPMSLGGQVGAFIFTLLGFPLHLFFLLNLGRTIAVKTQIFAKQVENGVCDLQERIINVRRFGEDLPRDSSEIWPEKMFVVDFKPPPWLRFFPIFSTIFYYILGLLVFGVARGMCFPKIILFFIDFSSTSGSTNGMARIGYTWYLEGAAILTAVNAVIYKDSPFEGLTPLGIKLGFMTNSLD